MADSSQYNIHSICRICLEYLDSESVYDLFAIPGLAKKLQLCTSLSVEPQDGFPKNLCDVCYAKLNELHDFQKQCVDSVQKFQELVASENVKLSAHRLDLMETGGDGVNDGVNAGADDDDRLNFDPLLNHKMEMIENEEDVFKMLEHVDKDVEPPASVAPLGNVNQKLETNSLDDFDTGAADDGVGGDDGNSDSSSESDDADDDEDFVAEDGKSDESNSSDDDLPLMLRLRKAKEGNAFKPKPGPKPKRKRIPAKERHLHTIIDCHICHKKFKKVIRYQEHMKYHNDKLPHQCSVPTCLKGFTTANGLRLHVEHAHTETVANFACPEEGCGRTFTRTRLLNWHLKKVHKIVKELNEPKCFPCSECEKVFRCQMALKKHMYKHDGKELPFPCNICGKRFVINSALKDHLMRHAGIKNYVCPYCGVGKTTRQEWNTHINTHTQEKKFQCHLCPHASHNKQNLRMHVKIVHEKIKDFACQYCGKTFGKSNACKMHEMTHTGEKRCECKVCGKRFLYPKGLTKHLKTHEKRVLRAIEVYTKRQNEKGENATGDAENAEGTTAGNSSAATVALPKLPEVDNNSTETHNKVAEEILKVCAESVAAIPKDPRRVERVDISQLAGTQVNPIPSVAVPSWSPQINFMMKEGPYICPDCGQGFNAQGNLKRHHRIVHEGVKDFACRFCHRRFAKAQTLKHHEMTHTGEKPHECSQCGKRFIQHVALKRHLKVHTTKPPPTIPPVVYEARQELHMQEIQSCEEKCKAEKEREAIAEAAKEQLALMKQQQEELLKIQKGHGRESYIPDGGGGNSSSANAPDDDGINLLVPLNVGDCDLANVVEAGRNLPQNVQVPINLNDEMGVAEVKELLENSTLTTLGEFQHINTSTMGIRTIGIND